LPIFPRQADVLHSANLIKVLAVVISRLWRYSSIALSVLVLVPAFSAHAAEAEPSRPKDSQAIIARGIIRVAITKFDLPAFHWRDANGELTGPEIDLARVIGRLLKVGVEFVDDCATFEAVVDAVANGRADIGLSKLSQTPYRVLRGRFSNPYLTLRQAFLFDRVFVGAQAAGRPPEETLRKFSGTLGVIAKSEYVDFAQRNFPDAQVSELQTWDDSVEALMNNRVDAIYRDEFEIRRVLKKNPMLNVRFGSAAFTDLKSFLSIAICDTCVRLQEFINYQIAANQVPFALPTLLASDARN
jgi:ABC-type amino acid transport substrate-binding protein